MVNKITQDIKCKMNIQYPNAKQKGESSLTTTLIRKDLSSLKDKIGQKMILKGPIGFQKWPDHCIRTIIIIIIIISIEGTKCPLIVPSYKLDGVGT